MKHECTVGAAALAFLLLWCASPVEAASYYLKSDHAFNGDGALPGPAASNGSPGAFNSIASFADAMARCSPGDVFYVRARADGASDAFTGNAGGGSNPLQLGGLNFGCSGTAGNPVRLRTYPGENGRISNCPDGSKTFAACDNATVTAFGRSYIHVGACDGPGETWSDTSHLIIGGVVSLVGEDQTEGRGEVGNEITCVEITQGWNFGTDGNWSAVWLSDQQGPIVRRVYAHDISLLSGAINGSSMSCWKFYRVSDAINEFNTCERVSADGGSMGRQNQAGGIDDKERPRRNIHRYNRFFRVPGCLRGSNQVPPGEHYFYGNECVSVVPPIGEHAALKVPFSHSEHTEAYNNTFYGFARAVYNSGENTKGPFKIYNNIFAAQAPASPPNNLTFETACAASGSCNLYLVDYNIYTNGINQLWHADANHTSLSSWRSRTTFDAHSIVRNCTFVGAPADLRLTDKTCSTHGRVGGVSTGAPVAAGWEGVTACVGHRCGATMSPTPPKPEQPR